MVIKEGKLYICPTPIGNLEDITIRVLRQLRRVDLIAAEDTRQTRKLLNKYKIKTRTISYHQHNEAQRSQDIIHMLQQGESVALVSNAGTPGLSDPGFRLIQSCLKNNLSFEVLPGPSAILTAVISSGLVDGPFAYFGFTPRKENQRKKFLKEISKLEVSIVLYESPMRLLKLLNDMQDIFQERKVSIVRELTKIHEEVLRGKVNELIEEIKNKPRKGEIVVIIGQQDKQNLSQPDSEEIIRELKICLSRGLSIKNAVLDVSQKKKLPKNLVYEIALNNKELL